MAGKYIIRAKETVGRYPPLSRILVARSDSCIRCGKCISTCIYEVHGRNASDPRLMGEPVTHRCRSCFACIQDCPAGALSLRINPEFEKSGDGIFTPGTILTIMREAETGNTPISGGGYGGPFSGEGFDGMWTDMSEIVRPTRDGIHGREYISTAVDLGRKPSDVRDLEFDSVGNPLAHIPPSMNVNLPVLFDTVRFPISSENLLHATVMGAVELGSLVIIEYEKISDSLAPFSSNIIPSLYPENTAWGELLKLARTRSLIELVHYPGLTGLPESLKKVNSELIVMIRVNEPEDPAAMTLQLFNEGADIIHLVSRTKLPEVIDRAHSALVEAKVRDQLTLIGSDGIAEAVHVPKAIILGADAVTISRPILIAFECTLCRECEKGNPCVRKIDDIPAEWGASRLKNLMAAWHNQLLEILGAMGLREVARLRGEKGRAMFAKEMEREFIQDIRSSRTVDQKKQQQTSPVTEAGAVL